MRVLLLLCVLMLVAACSNSTGPAGHDPSVLVTNQTDWPVDFAWRDGQGVAGADTVPALTERCERSVAERLLAIPRQAAMDRCHRGAHGERTLTGKSNGWHGTARNRGRESGRREVVLIPRMQLQDPRLREQPLLLIDRESRGDDRQ